LGRENHKRETQFQKTRDGNGYALREAPSASVAFGFRLGDPRT